MLDMSIIARLCHQRSPVPRSRQPPPSQRSTRLAEDDTKRRRQPPAVPKLRDTPRTALLANPRRSNPRARLLEQAPAFPRTRHQPPNGPNSRRIERTLGEDGEELACVLTWIRFRTESTGTSSFCRARKRNQVKGPMRHVRKQ